VASTTGEIECEEGNRVARPAVSIPDARRDGCGVIFVGLAGSCGDVGEKIEL
jgi:hypothetical protein